MGKKISLNDIESRLGRQNRPVPQYDEYGYETPVKRPAAASAFDDEDNQNTLSAGFIATCVAAFLAVGGGTFFLAGGELSIQSLTTWKKNGVYTDYVSKVDAKCSVGWADDRLNRDQLHCYLATNVARLCDPQEKGHLMNVVQRFQDAAMVSGAVTMGGTLKMVSNQGKMMQIGMAGAMASEQGLSEEEQLKRMDKVAGLVDDVMGDVNAQMVKDRNDKSMDDLKAAMRKLAARGYIKIEDFGWTSPEWVQQSFEGVKIPAAPPCKQG